MPHETSAQITILGAGPVGLEAALYGRYLGYQVSVFERGRIAENVRRWGHVRLFSPLAMNVSTLGAAAIEAHRPNERLPDGQMLLTGHELVDGYLAALAETDLLAGSIHEQTEVLAVGRDGLLKGERVGDPGRGEIPFRILTRHDGQESISRADIVLDTTGVFGNHNHLGSGGLPAVGELAVADDIEYGLPDLAGADREHFVDRHVLVIGAGYSAATNVTALASLSPDTRVTWVTRGASPPITRIADDRLAERDRLAEQANLLANDAAGPVTHREATLVESIAINDDATFTVTTSGQHAEELHVDRIIANVGYHGDRQLTRELQLHECYATGGPMKLAAALLGETSVDCLDQISPGPQTLDTSEPNFYVLGAKSYGRNSAFLMSLGRQQVRDVFQLITGRDTLDLYASVQPTYAGET